MKFYTFPEIINAFFPHHKECCRCGELVYVDDVCECIKCRKIFCHECFVKHNRENLYNLEHGGDNGRRNHICENKISL